MASAVVISEFFVRPKLEAKDSEKNHYLSPLALKMLSLGNTQYGLLFNGSTSSTSSSNSNLFDNLKRSLSHALVYYYPLAGRLVTEKHDNEHSCSIFVDCIKGPGARLIHASALNISVADVVNLNTDVPLVVQSFFDLGERQVNYDGHTRALLSLQMTELADGLFIGCCINHCVADGTSLSHFLNILSCICVTLATQGTYVSIPVPLLKSPPSLSESYPTIKLPYMEVDEFITRFSEGELRDKIFHLSALSMARLKAKANAEAATTNTGITLSSYKALCGLIWMSITRARNLPHNEDTTFLLTVNIRSRIKPPLPTDFFASCFVVATATAKAGQLVANGLGSATMMIHHSVESVDHDEAHAALVLSPGASPTVESPGFVTLGTNPVVMGGSPRFDFYGVDFGLGKPVAVRTGYTNRADGKLTAFPSSRGPGSIDVQVGLLPENMSALLLDEEFLSYVS